MYQPARGTRELGPGPGHRRGPLPTSSWGASCPGRATPTTAWCGRRPALPQLLPGQPGHPPGAAPGAGLRPNGDGKGAVHASAGPVPRPSSHREGMDQMGGNPPAVNTPPIFFRLDTLLAAGAMGPSRAARATWPAWSGTRRPPRSYNRQSGCSGRSAGGPLWTSPTWALLTAASELADEHQPGARGGGFTDRIQQTAR